MGQLINGVWTDDALHVNDKTGAFKRNEAVFRNWITADGAPGPTGDGGFRAESGRYHLYVSYACPWAHRTLIFRALKGLEGHITIDAVHPDMLAGGWSFSTDFPGATGDSLGDAKHVHDLYIRDTADVSTRATVPVLWDRETGRIVSNESSEIIRMFNTAFNGLTGDDQDFWPEDLHEAIAPVNDRIYHTLNNGVYRCGFATTQAAYDDAVGELFDTLAWLEDRLAERRYLMGDRVTEADWRLFPTLVRFDAVYVTHFKCDRARIVDHPNLWAYTRDLYQTPGVAETVRMDHIRRHYFYSHESINPRRIVSTGPALDFMAPNGRG